MSLNSRIFSKVVCTKCTNRNNGLPPCIRPHRTQSHGLTVFRVIDSPGGKCPYYATWPELAPRVLHGNYVAYDEWTTRTFRDGLKPLLQEFQRTHKGTDVRSGEAAERCRYGRVGDEVGYIISKDKAQNIATIWSVLSIPPVDPLLPKVLRFFQENVTKKVTPGTKWTFCTCGGLSGGGGPGTVSHSDFVLIDPNGNKWRYRLTGGGIGKLSPPVSINYSSEDWWSKGYVYNLTDAELEKEDLAGGCSYADAAAVLGVGWSGTVIWTKSAFIFMGGQAVGTPGIDKCAGSIDLIGPSNDTKC